MRYRILIGLVSCLTLILPGGSVSSAARQHAPAPLRWLQGWPMVGHDPQRTSRSPDTGPLHPRLLFARKGFRATVVDPDGGLYGWDAVARGVGALDAAGQKRWAISGCCAEGTLALAPDGTLLDTGFLSPDKNPGGNGTVAIAIRPDGTLAWRIDPFGLAKGALALVSENNLLYAPVIGPEREHGTPPYFGLNVISTGGTILRQVAQEFYTAALGRDGTIYDGGPLRAVDPGGRVLWQHNIGALVGPLVGHNDTLYVGLSNALAAYRSSGMVRWTLPWRDQPLALAERADGVLLVAGHTWLGAVGPDGRRLWRVRVGGTKGSGESPSLVVDASGTAYVGTGDGKLRVVSRRGTLLATLAVASRRTEDARSVPTCILGPHHRLIVNGTDGVLRVYGR